LGYNTANKVIEVFGEKYSMGVFNEHLDTVGGVSMSGMLGKVTVLQCGNLSHIKYGWHIQQLFFLSKVRFASGILCGDRTSISWQKRQQR